MPYRKPLKTRAGETIVYDSGNYPAAQDEVLAAIDWAGFPARQAKARAEGRLIGIGLAHAMKGTGRGPFESGVVRVSPSGRISVYTGAAAMGQGLKTALAQICASELGVSPAEVQVISGDTSVVPVGLGGFASRQTVTAGSSVLLASRAVAQKAKKLASHVLEVAEEDLEFADGSFRVAGAPQIERTARRARAHPPGRAGLSRSRRAWSPGCRRPRTSAPMRSPMPMPATPPRSRSTARPARCGCCATSRCRTSGTLVNPMIVDGQVHGGIAHGIGNALLEWMGYDASGQPMTTNFADYLLPTAPVFPMFETRFMQTPSPLNPLGAKGAGEVGTIPAAAAVVSAIEDALQPLGVRITQSPVTPAHIVELIARERA